MLLAEKVCTIHLVVVMMIDESAHVPASKFLWHAMSEIFSLRARRPLRDDSFWNGPSVCVFGTLLPDWFLRSSDLRNHSSGYSKLHTC